MDFFWYVKEDRTFAVVWTEPQPGGHILVTQFIRFYLSEDRADCREWQTTQEIQEFQEDAQHLNPIEYLPDFLEEQKHMLHPREYERLVEKFV